MDKKDSKQQINKLAGALVEFQDTFEDMSKDDRQWVIMNTKAAIGLFIVAVKKRASELLSFLGTSVSPATTEKFVAKEKFVVDTSKTAKVKISYVGSNFQTWFYGKTEEPKLNTTLSRYKFLKDSVDGPVIAELGGETVVETTLQDAWTKMVAQANGETGELLTNGYANIFYVRDTTGTLRAVHVLWYGDGWLVGAGSLENPDAWHAGHRVFSRNSSASQAV